MTPPSPSTGLATGGPIGDGRSALADFRPDDVDPLRELVRDQVAQGLAIYPRGGGTAMDYGGIPGRPGVAVDTRSIDRLIDYPFADMTITVAGRDDALGAEGDPGRAASAAAG